MGWRDWLRRQRKPLRPHHLIRGDDLAVLASPQAAAALEVQLGREGFATRSFPHDKGLVEALEKSLPQALVVVPHDLKAIDWEACLRRLRERELLASLPFVVLAETWEADQSQQLGETVGALCVEGRSGSDVAEALHRWRHEAGLL